MFLQNLLYLYVVRILYKIDTKMKRKNKIDPTQAKNLIKAWNESENGLNINKVSRDLVKSIQDSPLFAQDDKQIKLF